MVAILFVPQLDRVGDAIEDGIDDLAMEVGLVPLEHRQEQILLGGEEVVKAAALGAGFLEDLRDPGSAIALMPKEFARRFDESIFGGGGFGHGFT